MDDNDDAELDRQIRSLYEHGPVFSDDEIRMFIQSCSINDLTLLVTAFQNEASAVLDPDRGCLMALELAGAINREFFGTRA